MILYAESSAVLAWLFGEARAPDVLEAIGSAEQISASDLTIVECDRVIRRAVAGGLITEAAGLDRRGALSRVSARWHVLHLDPQVVERARGAFPVEPVRTLDAFHLAAALRLRAAAPDLALLTLDRRIRENGTALGFDLLP